MLRAHRGRYAKAVLRSYIEVKRSRGRLANDISLKLNVLEQQVRLKSKISSDAVAATVRGGLPRCSSGVPPASLACPAKHRSYPYNFSPIPNAQHLQALATRHSASISSALEREDTADHSSGRLCATG